jgi:hypothetical protein
MYGKVGIQSLSDGSSGPVRIDTRGNISTSGGGNLREATAAGRIFAVANQAVVTNTAGLAATYTGLALVNPVGSGKNLVILEVGCINEIALPTAACVFGLMTGAGISAATAVIIPRNRLTGGPASKAYVDSAVIFTEAPVLEQVFGTFHTGAVTTAIGSGFYVKLDGSLIITPGYHVCPYLSAINAATFQMSFLWEEIDA